MKSRQVITVEHFLKVLEEMADKGSEFYLNSEMNGEIYVKAIEKCMKELAKGKNK